MGFLKKLLGPNGKGSAQDENIFIEIGEIDSCPYCNTKLEVIPKAKKKCPHCEKYIFSRTQPLDRKKVLIREDQKEEFEREWEKYHSQKEVEGLTEDSEYMKAKKELKKQFGKEPLANDVKWRIYNQKIITLALNRQWGLYRNNKLDIARLLEKEGRHIQTLSTFLEICYLDLNGCRNMGTINGKPMSKQYTDELGIRDFDISMAFLAPGIISMLKDKIIETKLTISKVKKIFIEINSKTKPLIDMPLTPERAWEKLRKEL